MRSATDNLVPSSEWPWRTRCAATIPRLGHTSAQCVRRRSAWSRCLYVDIGRTNEQPGAGGAPRHLQRAAHLQSERRGKVLSSFTPLKS